jgi:hypothetical protein
MKWKAKPLPGDGDERWTLIFAWLPHRCSDGYWRWLCDLYVRQAYSDGWLADGWFNLEYSAELPSARAFR